MQSREELIESFKIQREYELELFNKVNELYKQEGSDIFLDEDGYPSDDCITWIKYYPYDLPVVELLKVIKFVWWHPDYSFDYKEEYCHLDEKVSIHVNMSCLGWSGNESIIRAMESNWMFWCRHWYQSTRGGHYTFEFKDEVEEICKLLES